MGNQTIYQLLDTLKALQFQMQIGVDEQIIETPLIRLTPPEIKPPEVKPIAEPPPPPNPVKTEPMPKQEMVVTPEVLGSQEAAQETAKLATAAQDLDMLDQAIREFNKIALVHTARHAITAKRAEFAPDKPRIMVIQDNPATEEDQSGTAFYGEAAMLTQAMLSAINLNWQELYACYAVNWRPPGNRTLTKGELMIAKPFLERQIELVKPDLLLIMGKAALLCLFAAEGKVTHFNGAWFEYASPSSTAPISADAQNATIPALSIIPPQYLLKNPLAKPLAWQALLSFKEKMDIL